MVILDLIHINNMEVIMKSFIKKVIVIILIFILIYTIYIIVDSKKKSNIIDKNTTQLIDDIRNINVDRIEISSITNFNWDEAYFFIPYTPKKYQEMAMGKQRGVDFFTPNESDTCLAFLNKGKVVCYLGVLSRDFNFNIVLIDKNRKTYYSKFKKTDNLNFVINKTDYDKNKGIYFLNIFIE